MPVLWWEREDDSIYILHCSEESLVYSKFNIMVELNILLKRIDMNPAVISLFKTIIANEAPNNIPFLLWSLAYNLK